MAAGRSEPGRRRRRDGGENRTVGDLLEDLQVAAAIQGALLALAPSTGLRVDVDAEEGIVYLRGEVASEEQRRDAERIVHDLLPRGVRRIVNELSVNPLLPPLPHP